MSDKVVVFISGKDPVEGRGGGAQHYARVRPFAEVKARIDQIASTGIPVVNAMTGCPLRFAAPPAVGTIPGTVDKSPVRRVL